MAQERTSESPDLTVSTAAQALLADDFDIQDEQVVADDAEPETDEIEEVDEPEEGEETDEVEEDEGESEEDDEEPEEEDEEPEEPPKYTVKVDGEEVEVTLDELQKGYSRTQDYTRKTMELAEQRKAAEAELQQIRGERERYAAMLEQLQAQAPQEQEPDWEGLYQRDPIEWVRQRELWRTKQEQQQRLAAERQRIEYQRQQEQAQEMQKLVAENQQKLLDAVPEWADPETGTQERKAVKQYLQEIGFSGEEVSQIYDHRAVLVARDAMRYRQMMQKRKSAQPTRTKTKTAKPGVSTSVAEQGQKTRKRTLQRLQQSGRVADAASAIENLL
jgi:hypothetical protein